MDYGFILRRSLQIAWNHKWLWLLALFAGEGAVGGFGFNYRVPGGGVGGGSASVAPPSPDATQAAIAQALAWLGDHALLIVVAALILLVIVVALFLLSAACASAVVQGAAALDLGYPIGLGSAWDLGMAAFGRVLRLKLLQLGIVLAALLATAALAGLALLAWIVQAWPALVISGLAFGGAVVVLVAGAVVLDVAIRLGLRSVVLDRRGARDGLRTGFAMISRRFGRVAVLWLIQVVVGIAAAIGTVVLLLALAVPVALILVAAFAAGPPAGVVAIALAILLLVPLLLVVQSAVAAYMSVYWTLGYRRLATG